MQFFQKVPCLVLVSLVFLAQAQRPANQLKDVDVHELARQNKITKQILEAFIHKKLGLHRGYIRPPSIHDILPVEMKQNEDKNKQTLPHAEQDQEGEEDVLQSVEDDSLQSVESEQIDSIYSDEVAAQAVAILQSGFSQRNVSTQLNISRAAVQRVYHRFLGDMFAVYVDHEFERQQNDKIDLCLRLV